MSQFEELNQKINWDKVEGLIPAVVQNDHSGQVLMLGYMNSDALAKTLDTEQVTFFSRTKQRLWTKGETSGNVLKLKGITLDCDQDTLLVAVDPIGPTCHLGNQSCFDGHQEPKLTFIAQLQAVLAERKLADPEESYTASLFARGTKRICQKVGEEGVEVALAAMANDREELVNESSDLLYHLLVLLEKQEVGFDEVVACLQARHK
ncbi:MULTISPECIES: bifunctional phosphoribosyl-AMP cyclohydrolase/phosphoribosyl-ATP diphosphatase HisIE [Agarivorans]|uniref:Histidine biosynthesis bifunctional protein HisIE n=1 Tax=Agarivorans albus MKT 106 TaxID=1331007 RepID=R9PJD3_AGAAL|nr:MULTISPECIES: bifunctional phosphoribosyl-AMP cyclohydrolase/phosphoribosyl-ATP diphosphatase HisIE [Agarivorans]GAD01338.1 phosphoribosyl-AMP cyclohydrolase [Agarivorans albus MKT 106]GDY27485.1 histidine biosynthesis bifunctional protein HisIE [Agarivorans sp. Toyoura001]